MPVDLTGHSLTIAEVVAVSRRGEEVSAGVEVWTRMAEARAVVEGAARRGEQIYGLTTGAGVQKRVVLSGSDVARFNRRLVDEHRAGTGPLAPPDVVRAAMLRLANALAGGTVGVRPKLLARLLSALNGGEIPPVRGRGSVGQSDLAQLADLAAGVFGDEALEAGEGLGLVNSNAFSTGWAALAVHDTHRLTGWLETAAALSLEGLAANLDSIDPAIGRLRPYPGLQEALERLHYLLEGSYLWQPGAARMLQDPLCFRTIPQVQGALRDALHHAEAVVGLELNAAQGNPMVVVGEDRIVPVGNFDAVPLAAALDYLRIALATAVTSCSERVVKLLDSPWSGLATGLTAGDGTADLGLSMYAVTAQALAIEARTLAQPVSFELAGSSGAEGIEDRASPAPLAARRLSEMLDLTARLVAVELMVAAQAVDLRGRRPLGAGTREVLAGVRRLIPFMSASGPFPWDLEPLREWIGSAEASLDA